MRAQCLFIVCQHRQSLFMKEFSKKLIVMGEKKSASHENASMIRLCLHDKIQPLVPDKGPLHSNQVLPAFGQTALHTQFQRLWMIPCANFICPFSHGFFPVHTASSRFTRPSHFGIATNIRTFVPQLWHCAWLTAGNQERFAKLNTKYNETPKRTLL